MTETKTLAELRARIGEFDALDEQVAMAWLIDEARLDTTQLKAATDLAAKLAQGVRDARIDAGSIDLLTQEFSLDSQEGIALMCLAEAMLRVPDTETRNKLIRDKVVDQDWRSHVGQSSSIFVNATAWGLALTGKVLKPSSEENLASALAGVLRRGGEHAVRAGVAFAMRLLGKQFVTGQTIEEALGVARGREKQGYRYSYDMLGEAALTAEDADGYYKAYAHTIEMVGKAAAGQGPIEGPGVSVKLTGLHPRYEVSQHERVVAEMYPRLLELARAAKRWGIGFHLDQEESARFPLTLEMLVRLAQEPELKGWDGLGISLQAYQKRGRAVIDFLIALARSTERRLLVRLVKGAYWDTEIKRCQTLGTANFPVFTRKVNTDVSYLACAKALLAAQDAVFPQFATHNAFSIAAVYTLGQGKAFEFQCLHGMGESVYDQVVGAGKMGRACRVYAPVGPHATLLAYLVRRLIENGANTSFVNQVVDSSVSIADIVSDPVARAEMTAGRGNAAIALPRQLLPWRDGAATAGLDVAGVPMRSSDVEEGRSGAATDVNAAVDSAASAGLAAWAPRRPAERAATLVAAAEQLEAGSAAIVSALAAGGVLTAADIAEELRLAADACRFHAARIGDGAEFIDAAPLGVVAAIGPRSSPLAWPMANIGAALATGNAVVWKPATGNEAVADALVALLLDVGVPAASLQQVQGSGAIAGAVLATHPKIQAVLLGASRRVCAEVAAELDLTAPGKRLISRTTACSALIVDSSALPEQVISDAAAGAFDGAGLRGSALKLMGIQAPVADKILTMLKAMMDERSIGLPTAAATDVGPLPSIEAKARFEAYLRKLSEQGHRVSRHGRVADAKDACVAQPAIVELKDAGAIKAIDADVAGPVLHVIRWDADQIEGLLASIDSTLNPSALALHSRIYETAGEVLSATRAPNVFINRGVHAQRIGMQADGPTALERGPSVAGAFILHALCRADVASARADAGPFRTARGAKVRQFYNYPVVSQGRLTDRGGAEQAAQAQRVAMVEAMAQAFAQPSQARFGAGRPALRSIFEGMATQVLPAVMGEENALVFRPVGWVACLGPTLDAIVCQVMTAVACGNGVVLPASAGNQRFREVLGGERCRLVEEHSLEAALRSADVRVILSEAVGDALPASLLQQGHTRGVRRVEPGSRGLYPWWELVREQQVTVNASASGDNTQLMAPAEAG